MPIKNAKYAMKKTSKGEVRLAFVKGKVVEAKNITTGKTHTPAEFKADAKKTITKKAAAIANKGEAMMHSKKHEGMESKKMMAKEKMMKPMMKMPKKIMKKKG